MNVCIIIFQLMNYQDDTKQALIIYIIILPMGTTLTYRQLFSFSYKTSPRKSLRRSLIVAEISLEDPLNSPMSIDSRSFAFGTSYHISLKSRSNFLYFNTKMINGWKIVYPCIWVIYSWFFLLLTSELQTTP